MRFEAQRAHEYYRSGWRLVPRLSAEGRAVFLMMARTYHGLLCEIERRDFDVFGARVRVPRWKKLLFALSALPLRMEWM
jgi:phytoene synthase